MAGLERQEDGIRASRLRRRIDTGRTGDKVDHPDPAASPLGTDDEAAGRPPSESAVATAVAEETAPAEDRFPRGVAARRPSLAGSVGPTAAWLAGLHLFILLLAVLVVWLGGR